MQNCFHCVDSVTDYSIRMKFILLRSASRIVFLLKQKIIVAPGKHIS